MAGSTSANPYKGNLGIIGVDPSPPSSSPLKTSTSHSDQSSKKSSYNCNKEQLKTKTDPKTKSDPVPGNKINIKTKDIKRKESDAEDGQEDTEMPKPRPQPVKRDADISLILTPAQRVDMLRLNEGIHSRLEEQVLKPFNYLHLPVAQTHRVKIWNYGPAVAAQMPKPADAAGTSSIAATISTTKANTIAGGNASIGNSKTQKDQTESQQEGFPATSIPRFTPKINADNVNDTVSSMSVLKEEASQYFNKWKITFNKRFNDLVVPSQPSFSGGPPRQGQGAPRGGGVGPRAGPTGRLTQQGVSIRPYKILKP